MSTEKESSEQAFEEAYNEFRRKHINASFMPKDMAKFMWLAGMASRELKLPDHNTESLKLMKNKCAEDAIKNFTEYANEKVDLSPNEQMIIRFTARNTAGLMRNLLQNYIEEIKALNECEGEK